MVGCENAIKSVRLGAHAKPRDPSRSAGRGVMRFWRGAKQFQGQPDVSLAAGHRIKSTLLRGGSPRLQVCRHIYIHTPYHHAKENYIRKNGKQIKLQS